MGRQTGQVGFLIRGLVCFVVAGIFIALALTRSDGPFAAAGAVALLLAGTNLQLASER